MNPKHPKRPIEKERLSEFDYRIVVFGSRVFTDRVLFNQCMELYLRTQGFDQPEIQSRICFIFSEGRSGVSKLIADWCLEHGYHWCEFIPAWDDIDVEGARVRTNRQGKTYNALAGFWCNEEMAEVCTHGISFYDGVSSDTQDMMEYVAGHGSPCANYLVTIDQDEDQDAKESTSRRSRDPEKG
jgi:hypothetical protein